MKRRFLAILLSLCMLVGLFPTTAFAAEDGALDLANGSIVITATGYRQGASEETAYTGAYTITQTGSATAAKNTITVEGGTHTITLNGVNIDVSASHNEGDVPCAFAITGGDVTVLLAENSVNTLKSGHAPVNGPVACPNEAGGQADGYDVSFAGLWVKQSATLTIDGTGKLTAEGGPTDLTDYNGHDERIGNACHGAGIGACAISSKAPDTSYRTVGDITIHGGTINATGSTTGSYGGPGIGGGTNTANITITGGTVTAKAGVTRVVGCAGIGTAQGQAGLKTITISGGTVTATGGAAGIGGGAFQNCGTICITGGNVTAESKSTVGAGIGGGGGNWNQAPGGGSIEISGGTVTAKGGKFGAGIGGGGAEKFGGGGGTPAKPNDARYGGGASGNITISGGTVTATGGTHAPGIGSGSLGTLLNKNGELIAPATTTAVNGAMETITISGGTVTATSGANYITGNKGLYKLSDTDTGIGQGLLPSVAAGEAYETWALQTAAGSAINLRPVGGDSAVTRNGEAYTPAQLVIDGTSYYPLPEGVYTFGDSTATVLISTTSVAAGTPVAELIGNLNAWTAESENAVNDLKSYDDQYNQLSESLKYYVDISVAPGKTIETLKEDLKGTQQVTVTLDNGYDETEYTPQEVTYYGGEEISFPIPTRDNYNFTGWYWGDEEVTGADGKCPSWTYTISDVTLTAHWEVEITGTGTKADPYLLYSGANLAALSRISLKLNSPEDLKLFGDRATQASVLSAHYKLANDITLTTEMGSYGISSFKGVFDGDNKTIRFAIDNSGIICNDTKYPAADPNRGKIKVTDAAGNEKYVVIYSGLFNNTVGATIKNLTTDGSVKLLNVNSSCGVIVGTAANTTFENCTNKANFELSATDNTSRAGGIAGRVSGATATFTNCRNEGNVTSGGLDSSPGNSTAAGMFGYASEKMTITLDNCHNTGDMTATRQYSSASRSSYAAGLLFYTAQDGGTLTVKNCSNSGRLIANAPSGGNDAAGLCILNASNKTAHLELTAENCTNSGTVTATDGYAALLFGDVSGAEAMPERASYTNCFHIMSAKDGESCEGYTVSDTGTAAADGQLKVPVASNEDNFFSDGRYVAKDGRKVADIASMDLHKVYNDFSVNSNIMEDEFPFVTWDTAYIIRNANDYTNLVKAIQGNAAAQNAVLGGRLPGANAHERAVILSEAYVKIAGDFTLSDVSAIGLGTPDNPFLGKVDGQDHTVTYSISADALATDDAFNIGFIGYSKKAEIKDLSFAGSIRITADPANQNNIFVGAAVAEGSGAVVDNCHSTVTYTGSREVTYKSDTVGYIQIGGLVGLQEELTITNCTHTGNISSTAVKRTTAGGIAANLLDATVTNCTAKGNIEAHLVYNPALPVFDECSYVGGIAGILDGVVTNCTAAGIITATNTVPSDNTTVSPAYGSAYAGGLGGRVSANELTVTGCAALTTVSANSTRGPTFTYAGALVGNVAVTDSLIVEGANNWSVKTADIAAVSGVKAIDTTLLDGGAYGDSDALSSDGALPDGITVTSEIAELDADTDRVTYTKAATDTVSLVYDGTTFYTSGDITVSGKALSAGDVTVTGINDKYPSDEAAAEDMEKITVVYGDTLLTAGTDYTVTKAADGSHQFTISFIGNYSGNATVPYDVEADAPAVNATGYTGTYDANAHGISIETSTEGAVVTYCETAGGAYTETAPTKTDAGNYIVYFKVTKGGQEVAGSETIAIDKAELTVTAESETIYVSEDLPATFTYTVTGWQGEDADNAETLLAGVSVSCPTADNEKAGAYPITVTGPASIGNYDVTYVDGELTVRTPSSGDNSDAQAVTNPDGSITTTSTDNATGTVTETTKHPDGSTTEVETQKNGTVTTTETATDGVQTVTVSKPGEDVTATVTLPQNMDSATVTIPAKLTPGTVAVDAKTGELVMLSAPMKDGMLIKADGSAQLVLKDRSKTFIDTPGHWAEDNIDFVVAHELFNGVSETVFAPNSPMTRGMLMTVLARFDGQDTEGGATWYGKGMEWAMQSGVSDGTNPGANITREQLVTMLYRYAGSPAENGKLDRFPDADQVKSYAVDAMRWAVSSGIIKGMEDGTLNPQGNATRAQVSTMMQRFCVYLIK